jgi:hypothetical protein
MKEESNLNTNCLIHTQNTGCDLGWHLKWVSEHIAVGCPLYHCVLICVKVKVKFALERATKAQRGSRGVALLFP